MDDEQYERWRAEQVTQQERLVLEDRFAWNVDNGLHLVDISFEKGNEDAACATLVVLSFPQLVVVHERSARVRMTQPYVSGFLAFREVPALVPLVHDLKCNHPELVPQVILVDGNGILHPRGFGQACLLGLETGIPTVGVAKTFLHVDGLTERGVKFNAAAHLHAAGDSIPLIGDSGKVWGVALRGCDTAMNPIFVSPGHLISLETATQVVHRCCLFRIPEPIRQADIRSRCICRGDR